MGKTVPKTLLRQGSNEECKEALNTLELRGSLVLDDIEEAETSLVAQGEDVSVEDRLTPETQIALLVLMEAEAKADEERFDSLLAQMLRNSSETRSLRKEFEESMAKKIRYFDRCRATLLAGGRLQDVEVEKQ
ncbi:uncharacterized protein N7500_007981 [Penicillium coprophilum]|uniref:uncharacterized protein n=1 Tax=Penicillium coprophilum TaxID=36646 RepID=UPI00239F9756|nr:uncharacterized protein N7500_007981 [Penicillium coprophilum]KAJ5158330.1 hypothetical protein N7500_007981 [Penicillium coprophilum]